MLAYLFWHQRRPGTSPREYESALRKFHGILAQAHPVGYLGSSTLRFDALPFMGSIETYEDAYYVSGFGALGTLNQRAVEGVSKAPHDKIADRSLHGKGGLYRLLGGHPTSPLRSRVIWGSKRTGRTYAELREAVDAHGVPQGSSLWVRELGLGPAEDLAFRGSAQARMPAWLEELMVPELEAVGSRVVAREVRPGSRQ